MGKPAIIAGIMLLSSSLTQAAAERRPGVVRFATFNASLNRESAGALIGDLSTPDNTQARNVAEIIQRVAPDVLLINEFDHDQDGKAADLFQQNYLAVSQHGAPAIVYAHRYTAAVNTGIPSGVDLDHDGKIVTEPGTRGYGNDAFGFGQFPGQYGMVLYSRFPLDVAKIRRFGKVLWKDMPGALLPLKKDGTSWYSPEALAVFRLSSKDHWDIPVLVNGRTMHVLASHPTPPAFDGPEDRNGKRNHDEIRLWADYLTGGENAAYLGADAKQGRPAEFVILGDLNSDPVDGGSVPGAIDQLLNHPRVDARFIPTSAGADEASRLQGGANQGQHGPADQDTADFDDRAVGNLRADYVLPSKGLHIVGGGVFWPRRDEPLAPLVGMSPVASSDHRLVYLDLDLGETEAK
ncbi:Endonuclease/Exonuclease/phosphatase family protein [Singulisphaera sp. GP187]|uniref:endonuclease/exonuclease/phosphatase family protein n=1 Tax=Singulisphaera sp. GP187 TaxID=1882752 RepID=UPI00092BAF6A|nr:endonuclease/exonuclease/phosphatase family protein [Singulisphaera sp. GP187]SIO41488.1 Endonuclease/Exonuclease/phosphatase family protein [Singulisphaera sp. GP187]